MSSDSIDKLAVLVKNLEKQINKQNKIIEELKTELKAENKMIIENTTKMGNHIDFINSTYEKLTKSYLFRNIFT